MVSPSSSARNGDKGRARVPRGKPGAHSRPYALSRCVGLNWDVTSVPVGEGSAAFIATDPEVGDEGWLEVFESSEAIAVVQASPEDDSTYGATVTAALEHPEADDERGDAVQIRGGRLVFVSAALDGEGEDSPPLQAAAEALPDTWPGSRR